MQEAKGKYNYQLDPLWASPADLSSILSLIVLPFHGMV
jgi:hypothetical protein